MLTRRQRRAPTDPSSLVTVVAPAPGSDGAKLTVTWIGHSSFLIKADGVNILTDPIWSNRASPIQSVGPRRYTPPGIPFEKLPSIDAVFISHDHYDHLDKQTVRRLTAGFPHAKWIAPLGVGNFLKRQGAAHVTELDWWQESDMGAVSARCTPAQHFSGRYPWNRNATLWCGWVIGVGRYRVFFAGDTGLHPDFGEIVSRFGPFDAAIIPIGAYEPRWFMRPVHMSPEDAVVAYLQISHESPSARKCVFIPSHWGTFRLTDEPLDEPPRLLRKAWMDAGLPEDHLSWIRLGERSYPD